MSPPRRLAALLLAVASLAVITPACGNGGARRSDALRVWIMEPGSPDLKAFLTRASTEFEQDQAGAKVALQFVPWASAHDQFVTAIGGGQAPDVAEMGSTWTPEFGDIGALVQAGTSLDGYVPSLVEGATVGGKTYGLPWYAGARALIYRKDVLAGLGLSPPTTWDELLRVGRAVRDRAHLSAFGVAGNAAHYFLPMVWQNGGELATQKNGTWVSGLDSPRAVAAIQFYADLYATEHFAPAGALSWNARDVRAAFEAGDLAMMIGGGWDVRAMLAAHPDLAAKVGTTLLPAGPSGSRDAFAGGSHLVVFEGTRHEDLARRYVRFLLDPARVESFSQRIGFLPGERAALALDPRAADPLYSPFTDQLEAHSRTYPPARQWGGFEADGLFTNAIQQVMGGRRSAQAAMAGVAKAMNQAFNE